LLGFIIPAAALQHRSFVEHFDMTCHDSNEVRNIVKRVPSEWKSKSSWIIRLFNMLQLGLNDNVAPIYWSPSGLHICVRRDALQIFLLSDVIYKASKLKAFFRRLNEFGFKIIKDCSAKDKNITYFCRNEITSKLDCDTFVHKCTSNRRAKNIE